MASFLACPAAMNNSLVHQDVSKIKEWTKFVETDSMIKFMSRRELLVEVHSK